MADSDWDEDDREIVLTEGRFDLGKEDGSGDIIKDDCDKHDDNCSSYRHDNMSCNILIINFKNLIFPFSIS